MLFSVLIYDSEEVLDAVGDDCHQERLEQHHAFQEPLRDAGKLGAVVRLMGTPAAVTLRGGDKQATVLDGPFAETKEQLLGFYLIQCDSLEEAIEAAKQLPLEGGALEIRPVMFYEGGNFQHGEPLVLRGS